MTEYAELHAHSSYSFLDGASAPETLVRHARQLGLGALALTDHNGLYGAVKHHLATVEAGLKGIFGAEMTLDDESHLVLLATDERGWSSLCRLISRAQLDHAKGRARLDRTQLTPQSTTGLIALSGCREGSVSRHLLEGSREGARAVAEQMSEIFGRDAFYIELQAHRLPDDHWLNQELVALARDLELEVVATNNVHYARTEDRDLQDVVVAISRRASLDQAEAAGWLRSNSEYRLKSGTEMAKIFDGLPRAISNTMEIAGRCSLSLDLSAKRFPGFQVPAGETPFSYLYRLCHQGVTERYRPIRPVVLERLAYELKVIESLNLAEFFLINWDIMRFARENGIPGQGRGSAADSLVAYVLGITRVDPIEHRLLFARFLHEGMRTTPDIDVDFSAEHREQVIQYVYEKYGWERTGMVCNVVTFRPRSSIRQVGRALGFPPDILDRVAKSVDAWYPESITESVTMAGFRERSQSLPWDTLIDLAQRLCGHPRHLSIHVGGMLVTGEPLVDMVPVERATMPGRVVVQFNKDDIEDLGLIKMDMLSLRTLSVVAEALQQIEAQTGERLDLDRLPLDDPRVFDLCCASDTIGVFQIESRAQIATLPRTRPREFNHLVVEVAIIRPGPIQGNAVNPYIKRRQGKEPVTYLHPLLEPILGETLGVVLYQEQVIEISMALAGFPPAQADLFRRAMNRHRSRVEMEEIADRFVAGCVANGVSAEVAQEVFLGLASFAEFGFTKSHAAAFARTAYETAWLKLNYGAYYYAGLLNLHPVGFYSPAVIVEDARRHGVGTLRVDVNVSGPRCVVEEGAIRLGFNYVRGLGAEARRQVAEERAKGEFGSPEDFVRRTRLSRTVVNDLVRIGAFDSFGLDRRELLWRDPGRVQPGAFIDDAPLQVELAPMTVRERTEADYAVSGVSTDRHVVSFYREQLKELGVTDSRQLSGQPEGARLRVAGLVITRQAPMTARGLRFFTLEDEWGHINLAIFPDIYQRVRAASRAPIVLVDGVIQRGDGGVVSVLVKDLVALTSEADHLLASAPPGHDFY